MASEMLTVQQAINRGLDPDPFVFTDVTHRVPESRENLAGKMRPTFYESRWFFGFTTEIITMNGMEMTWLSIRRNDRKPLHDFRHLQKIKNAIFGEEREACQIYPSEKRLMDASNQTHLWVLEEGAEFPWGYGERDVMTRAEVEALNDGAGVGAVQRAFDSDTEVKSRSLPELMEKVQTAVRMYHTTRWQTCQKCGNEAEWPTCYCGNKLPPETSDE